MLVFVFDYLLWIVVVVFFGGKVVYYICDEEVDWYFDFDDICSKIILKICGIVLINFNNLTGVVYSCDFLLEIIEIVCKYKLMIFVDEIYDKVLYDGVVYILIVILVDDVLVVIFNGLFKVYCVCGFCGGWMFLIGFK